MYGGWGQVEAPDNKSCEAANASALFWCTGENDAHTDLRRSQLHDFGCESRQLVQHCARTWELTMALSPGTRFGPYEVGDEIGAGGMGVVYRATDTKLKRDVAIKVLPESFATDTERLGTR